ncbi:MAG: hypothetical protein KH415_13380 [Clostridium sp.]|jgi:hypothetical protein|nr:hypothetical protein [Clostridium sp.]
MDERILSIIEQCNNLKLIGYINGKDEIIEIDMIAKSMLIGYLAKKKALNK